MRVALILMITLCIPCQHLLAADAGWKQNTQLLPQYCKDRARGGQSPEFSKWRRTFGDAYIHMHHYCNGVYAEKKARSTINQQERSRWLGAVIGEMQYVGRHCGAGCSLYPELHSRMGWALGKNGQVAEAIEQFQLVIKVKPKYTLAYAQLSDLYVEIKQLDEARKVLEKGLKVKPGSRSLQRRLEKLETAS